jgi:hypothetical protein
MSLETGWWSLVLDERPRADTIRNGSCGDPIAERTMIAVDDGPAVFPAKSRG